MIGGGCARSRALEPARARETKARQVSVSECNEVSWPGANLTGSSDVQGARRTLSYKRPGTVASPSAKEFREKRPERGGRNLHLPRLRTA